MSIVQVIHGVLGGRGGRGEEGKRGHAYTWIDAHAYIVIHVHGYTCRGDAEIRRKIPSDEQDER